jgi:biopolymer transport protein ExbB/TolQ/pimeloyl-ACP methyl ester carboxylesterase
MAKVAELDRVVDAAGLRLHLHCEGEGSPAVVFDAGAGNDGSSWRTVQPGVARVTRACSYDRAGLGYSGPGRKPRNSARMAMELHALLAAAQVPPPYVLVGHSAGGLNVRLFANDYFDEVAGMVLVDATPAAARERLTPRLSEQERQQQRERLQRGPDGWDFDSFQESMQLAGAAPALGNLPLVVLTAGRDDREGGPPPSAPPEEMKRRFEIWQELQVELAQLSSNSRHTVVPEARHFVHWDAPAVVVRAVRDVVVAARTGQRLEGAAPPAAPPADTRPAAAPPSAAEEPAPAVAAEPSLPAAPLPSPATRALESGAGATAPAALVTAPARATAAMASTAAAAGSSATLWERWQQGGLVMYFILALSAVAVATLLDHLLRSRRQSAQDRTLFEQADALWSAGQFSELEQLCLERQSAGAAVLLAIVRHRRQRYDDVNAVAGEVASVALREQLRRAAWLAVAATLSPLLGLFGTVVGMVEAFDAIAASGAMGDASLVASGISKALITTVAGLLVGIPALGARHFVFSRIHGAAAALEAELNDRLRRWLLVGREPS